MNKKIIIGSIIAVVILIGVSFTSVVGYRSVTSDVKASPLFNIRSSRAIDEESETLSCEYVGKGEEITISIPTYKNKYPQILKVLDVINKIDDETFKKVIDFLINHAQKNAKVNDINSEKIKESLCLLRSRDTPIPIFDVNANHNLYTYGTVVCCITAGCEITFGHGFIRFLGCLLAPLIFLFYAIQTWFILCDINS